LENETILISTFLDIRFKQLIFLNENKRSRIHKLINDMIDIGSEINTNINENLSFFNDFIEENTSNNKTEFNRYLNENYISNGKDFIPLVWWKNKKHEYPHLFKIAIKYLIIPASSTVDERENSHLGRLVTKLRNRLNAETTSNLSYMKYNSDLW
jgi:hypothetical protein